MTLALLKAPDSNGAEHFASVEQAGQIDTANGEVGQSWPTRFTKRARPERLRRWVNTPGVATPPNAVAQVYLRAGKI